jgi:tetraacyldisaccharide 4'-kinase
MRAALTALVERTWAGATPGARALRAALAPAAAAYGSAVRVRNALYDAGWLPVTRVPARVVAVGNLTVGGTGKTPTALWLAERLAARGHVVGIVARGYGKTRPGVVVVGEAGTPLVGAAEGGDEAVMLAARFRGPVVTAERRAAAAALACARYGCDTLVLDDGFQHRALARDADLVLLAHPPEGQRLLPAGPLREPPSGLRRASAVLTVGGDGALPPRPVLGVDVPAFRGRLRATALVGTAGSAAPETSLDALRDRPVVAVAGIAHPERLPALLRAAGIAVAELVAFPDHHRYGPADLSRLRAAAARGTLVTTEKDLVKLVALGDVPALVALRVALEVEDGDRLVAHLASPRPAELDLRADCS